MKKINVYIADDDVDDTGILVNFIAKKPELRLVGTSTDPVQALWDIPRLQADLVLLDVQMQPITGLEVLSQLDPRVRVILCTSYREFAVQGYEEFYVDYLVKPCSFPKFVQVVKSAMAKLQYDYIPGKVDLEYSFFFVNEKGKGKMCMIVFDELVAVISLGEQCVFILDDGRQIVCSRRIGKVYKELPKDRFLRVHNEHVIHMQRIKHVANGKVRLQALDDALDIGDAFARPFYEWIAANKMG